jgi:hypothetical protein
MAADPLVLRGVRVRELRTGFGRQQVVDLATGGSVLRAVRRDVQP